MLAPQLALALDGQVQLLTRLVHSADLPRRYVFYRIFPAGDALTDVHTCVCTHECGGVRYS